jgi:hypothetical protein
MPIQNGGRLGLARRAREAFETEEYDRFRGNSENGASALSPEASALSACAAW